MQYNRTQHESDPDLESRTHFHFVKEHLRDNILEESKEKFQILGDWLATARDTVFDFYATTKAEISTGLTIGIIAGCLLTYSYQAKQDHCLHYGFSETSAIDRLAAAMGRKTPNVTNLLTKAFDFYNKHFEIWDESWEQPWVLSDNEDEFASKLEYRIDITFKRHRYELPQLAAIILPAADSVLNDFNHIRMMQDNVAHGVTLSKQSWDEYHHDVEHEHCDKYTVTDSDGKTHEEETCYQVYDYTDNSYTYFAWAGNQLAEQMVNIKIWFRPISKEGHFLPTKEIGADNMYGMNRSRRKELKDRRLTDEEMLVIANSSLFGSAIYLDLGALRTLQDSLTEKGERWQWQKNTARSYSQRTYDYSHAESEEYQTSAGIRETGKDFVALTDQMIGAIQNLKVRIPKIMKMDSIYVGKTLNYMYKDSADVSPEDIMDEVKEGYAELYPEGAKIESSNYWWVLLGGAIGGAVGTGLGWALNWATDKTHFWERLKRKKSRNPNA